MATVSERLQCSTYHRLETTKAARACLGVPYAAASPILGRPTCAATCAEKRMTPSLDLLGVCKKTGRDRSAERQFEGKHKQVRGPGPVGEEAVL